MQTALWKACLLSAGLVLISACSSTMSPVVETATTAPQLFTLEPTPDRESLQKTATGYLATLLADPANEAITLVKINSALLDKSTEDLAVSLPNGKSAQFHLRDFTTITPGINGWVGYKPSEWKKQHPSPAEIDVDPLYYLSVVREGDKVVGNVVVDGQRYRLDTIRGDEHVLIKVDESKLPPEGEPIQLPEAKGGDPTIGKAPQSAHSTIRVLMVSTNQVRAKRPNYRQELVQALQDANQSMFNSKVDITYELAGIYDANYDEKGNSSAQLGEVQSSSTELGKAVYSVRDQQRADLVSMYSTIGEVCGRAYLSATKEWGYGIVSCSLSIAHELGHNLGVLHGWELGDELQVPPYMNGYREKVDPKFHTVMVTAHGSVPYFSNPRVQYQGRPMGTVEYHDAARRFNERRETVGDFYPAPDKLEVTVYDDLDMAGDKCTFELTPRQVAMLNDVCGGAWPNKVWSASVRNVSPGMEIRFGTESATQVYKSVSHGGSFTVRSFNDTVEHDLPEGMTVVPSGGNLNGKVDRVSLF